MVGGDKETLGGPRGMGSAQTAEQKETPPPHIALRDSNPCRGLCINVGGTRGLLHRYPMPYVTFALHGLSPQRMRSLPVQRMPAPLSQGT
jgi:hypothetical protein